MPAILRVKGFGFWLYEADLDEPTRVHVGKEGKQAKFWLNPIAVARTGKFRDQELGEIEKIILEHREKLLEAWLSEQRKHVNR